MNRRTYLVIGASSGIGKQVAGQLSEAGNQVFGTYNESAAEDPNGKIRYNKYNVLDASSDLNFVPEHLDGLIYCPGTIKLKPFARLKPDDFREDYELQVIGAVKSIQSVLPKLKKSEQASIVLFSTVAVQTGFNFHSLVASSKGAVEGLTKSLAAEFAPGIRVNCIAPSLTDTPLAASMLNTDDKREANAKRHPLRKIGFVEDIANMAEFLLSDKSSWISGQILHVDGGMSSLKV